MHRLSSLYTNLFRLLDFVFICYVGAMIFTSAVDEYSFVFFVLILILGRVDIFIKLHNKVLFDSENLYVGKNKVSINQIKSIAGISMLPPWFITITFKNQEHKNVYVLVKKPFIFYVNPFADKGSMELILLEKLVNEKAI